MTRKLVVLVLAALGTAASAAAQRSAPAVTAADVRALLEPLAHDSMEGRKTGTPGAYRAAAFIAAQMRRLGFEAAGDSGYLQRVPLVLQRRADGRTRPALVSSFAQRDTFPEADRRVGYNVLGIIPGSDPALRDEVVLVDAHYDHLGVGIAVDGDSIYNGADDDASGVVASLLIGRALAAGPKPKRTVIIAAMTGEETGLLGTRWYIDHPARPLAKMAANLEIEMIGRPDSLAGGFGKAWLTGYERSTMGDALKTQGVPIVADRRLDQHFFERSDNIAFARMGIVAHTLSSYNMHTDYHTPQDDTSRVDYEHMARVIDAGIRAARILADGPAPAWHPGGRPETPAGH